MRTLAEKMLGNVRRESRTTLRYDVAPRNRPASTTGTPAARAVITRVGPGKLVLPAARVTDQAAVAAVSEKCEVWEKPKGKDAQQRSRKGRVRQPLACVPGRKRDSSSITRKPIEKRSHAVTL